jgi:hypothetical protein
VNTKLFVFREHNYGLPPNSEIDVCGDVVVLSTLEKALDILRVRLIDHCSPKKSYIRKWHISESEVRPDFFADPAHPTASELDSVIDEEVKTFDDARPIYIRLYPDFPDNEDESLAFVIEGKTIDLIDIL